jgi:hypothetical protein
MLNWDALKILGQSMTLIRLSQQQLNVLASCPRKFQHLYLDNLSSPTTYEEQERLNWGSRFHLLIQQRELGLPIEPLVKKDPEMEECLKSFIETATEIFPKSKNPETFRQAEHTRSLNFQGYILTVIYDLLIGDRQQALILDWKTYRRPRDKSYLAKNWQTRLYPFVMVETSHYLPEQVSMTYWFVRPAEKHLPENLKFSYNQHRHEKTRQDLSQILSQLTHWLQRYQQDGELFPQIDASTGQCHSCQFAIRCDRDLESSPPVAESDDRELTEGWLSLDAIQEVSI